MEALSSRSAPLPHERLRGAGYSLVLVLILLSIGFLLGGGDTSWGRLSALIFESATLLAALYVSGARPMVLRAAAAFLALVCLTATVVVVSAGELSATSTRVVGLMLVVLAPTAIILGMTRHARIVGGITLTQMFAVLCIYLLLGIAFSYVYGVVAIAGDDPFFAQQAHADESDFLYFSIVTQTTTGYGDLTAASDLGRAFAVTQALVGQIYLVTVVALIVGNLGRSRGPAVRR